MPQQDLQSRAHGAKNLLDTPVFRAAVESVRAGLIGEMIGTKARDTELREKAYFSIRALDEVVLRLNAYINEAAFERKRTEKTDQKKSDGDKS